MWLADRIGSRIRPLADRHRELIIRIYGPERGAGPLHRSVRDLGIRGTAGRAAWARLFPFLPAGSSAVSPFTRKEWVDMPDAD